MHVIIAAAIALMAMFSPTSLVDTFVGTSGTPQGGPIDTFPGADVPFGMVQWSPDTPSQNAGGGYEYNDRQITGFSLTHLSGPGCSVFGDFGILPVAGDVPNDPAGASQSFSHASEESAPGWYAVSVGSPAIRTELTVTTRTGLGRFTFPSTSHGTLLLNASSNQAGTTDTSLHVDGPNEISGSASSGYFCGMPDQYTVYFVARFDRPFAAHGTWENGTVTPDASSARGPATGLWLTFDASSRRTVMMQVALSFVSTAGARANLAAENPGWNIIATRNRATEMWGGMLGRIAIAGGTLPQRRTFYSALYHTLLHPNVISDVTGLYTGFDGRVHRVKPGHNEYANYSDWDIYRTEVPLIALIAPGETSDMVQSLADAFTQSGWLPRWPLANGPSSVMGGDSVDPVIAGAYAFGARDFDARTALRAMVKGATSTQPPPAQGWYYERWELHDDYLRRGYVVNTHTTSVAPGPNGASETLEYALDDFAIARLAQALNDAPQSTTFLRRSSNWATLFDGTTGWIAPRDADGAFTQSPLDENGQDGFQEGNAAQYTWMVPQDLRDLVGVMGGRRAAVAKLDGFFAQLNAGPDKPYAWLGNEPSLGSPWVYLSAGEPWRAQAIVREAMTTLYDDTPAGLPGNDDLGTMSAWYLWCAMGIYPQEPAVRYLDLGAPLFPSIRVSAPNGPTIVISAPQAQSANAYVQQVRLNGRTENDSWVTLPTHGTLRLDFRLGAQPNTAWASSPQSAPPSFAASPIALAPSTGARLIELAPRTDLTSYTLRHIFQISNRDSTAPAEISWRATLPSGLHAQPANGIISLTAGGVHDEALEITADAGVHDGFYAVRIDASTSSGARLAHLDIPVRLSREGRMPPIAYAVDRFGNDVMPIDLSTGVALHAFAVGEDPHALALAPDGKRLYIADSGDNTVRALDALTGRTLASAKTGNNPFAVAVEPDGKTVWIANGDDGTVQAIDAATMHPSAPIRVGSAPRGIAIAPDGSALYVANSRSNSVSVVDLRTRRVTAEIAVGTRPWGIAVAPDGKRLYVTGTGANDVTPVDLARATALAPIRVGIYPTAIAIAPGGRIAYVANHANSTITPLDLQNGSAGTPIEVGGAPAGIAFTRDGATAIVVTSRDNTAVFVDVANTRVQKTIALGNGPYAVAVP